jgi:hypothetical protein
MQVPYIAESPPRLLAEMMMVDMMDGNNHFFSFQILVKNLVPIRNRLQIYDISFNLQNKCNKNL